MCKSCVTHLLTYWWLASRSEFTVVGIKDCFAVKLTLHTYLLNTLSMMMGLFEIQILFTMNLLNISTAILSFAIKLSFFLLRSTNPLSFPSLESITRPATKYGTTWVWASTKPGIMKVLTTDGSSKEILCIQSMKFQLFCSKIIWHTQGRHTRQMSAEFWHLLGVANLENPS